MRSDRFYFFVRSINSIMCGIIKCSQLLLGVVVIRDFGEWHLLYWLTFTWDDHIVRSLMENVQCYMSCSTVLSKSDVHKEVGNYRPIAFIVHCDDLNNSVLIEIWTHDADRSKVTPKSDFHGIHWTLLDLIWIDILNSTIWLVHVPIHPEMVIKAIFFAVFVFCWRMGIGLLCTN